MGPSRIKTKLWVALGLDLQTTFATYSVSQMAAHFSKNVWNDTTESFQRSKVAPPRPFEGIVLNIAVKTGTHVSQEV